MSSLYWIASYPKSGNTWTRSLFTAYDYGKMNLNVLSRVPGDGDPYYYQLVAPNTMENLNDQAKILIRPAALLHMVVQAKPMMPPDTPCLLKTHTANARVGSIDLIPGEMTNGAIYLIRDPRDVVISAAKHIDSTIDEVIENLNSDTNTIGGGPEPLTYTSSWSRHVESFTEYNNFPVLVVKYEDLVDDTIFHFSEMLKFTGYDVDKNRVKNAVKQCEFHKLQEYEKKYGFKECINGTFFNTGTYGGWKKTLTSEQIKKIEDAHGEVMSKYGYL